MNVVAGQSEARARVSRVPRVQRVRPGEVPDWINLRIGPAPGRAWRERAERRGIGVDAWLAVLVEAHLVMGALSPHGLSLGELLDDASIGNADARLAPGDALRRWVRLLEGGSTRSDLPPDELPAVVLPARLTAQIPARALSTDIQAATEGDDALPIACDRAAALQGLTLERWALGLALDVRRR
jgi:hypothetical protein